MPSARPDLISPATRNAFRSLCTDILVRYIHQYWQAHGFAPVAPEELRYEDSGVRRTAFQSYAQAVDWSDHDHIDRALLVFEDLVLHCKREGWTGTWLQELSVPLERDRVLIDGSGRLSWVRAPLRTQDLSTLTDPSGILVELHRVQRNLASDPAAAIGSAKQLIEATARTVLRERGLETDENAKIPALVKQAQKALRLDASSVTPGPDGTDAIKKILGGVSAVAVGVAELRNRGYGTGHGQASAPSGLGVRHAHLAANAAITWCELLLDTLNDPEAPWRKDGT
ncbi:abortive infection family protein [Streptacidiphilus fuscans]|uniref:Abortive infection family protein n=1 Tax=Streptacidiphilus fuscans TaxID=2789292 RepID=A0A931B847_9ACTN|nr:abortive infection family protein [Streptacidiphilus fuscans]MBF9071891.1 abortive infection family protein [Streptacidiphilus fuscans]